MRFNYAAYKRPFSKALTTARGKWHAREGFILRLTREEATGFGECAPLAAFGTESVAAAGKFLEDIPGDITESEWLQRIEAAPPATAYALDRAFTALNAPDAEAASVRTASLHTLQPLDAPEIEAALLIPETPLKIKLGLAESEREWQALKTWALKLTTGKKLRLDPNQSWTRADWAFWKPRLHGLTQFIDYIEEPFSPKEVSDEALLEVANESPVELALDERLARHPDAIAQWIEAGWPGCYVLKPSLLGPAHRWQELFPGGSADLTFSSAFESAFGLSALIDMASRYPSVPGFGTEAFFREGTRADPLALPTSQAAGNPSFRLEALSKAQLSALWTRVFES
jgi:o-succinylbenzoate synthase